MKVNFHHKVLFFRLANCKVENNKNNCSQLNLIITSVGHLLIYAVGYSILFC